MESEDEKVRETTEGSGQQQAQTPRAEEPNPVGQDSPKSEYGEIGSDTPSGSEPPRSMDARYGRGIDGPQSNTEGEDFILQQGSGPDDQQQELGSSARATEGDAFAPEGRGVLEGEQEDVEGGQSRIPRSDIEQE
jgi:hypothetical protein